MRLEPRESAAMAPLNPWKKGMASTPLNPQTKGAARPLVEGLNLRIEQHPSPSFKHDKNRASAQQ